MTAHIDTFARDHLPPRDEWPEFLYTLPALQYPPELNAGVELIDAMVARGFGDRPAILTTERRVTYKQLLDEANRIANVLRDDLGVVPGNRVLLRGFNNDVMAAGWLAVLKVGAIAVTTMPLLRARELVDVINAGKVTVAICDYRLREDLQQALPLTPTLETIVYSHQDGPAGLSAMMQQRPSTFANAATASDDVCMIAFTSGTTGKPKGTMHFHRDVLAVCDTFPPSSFKPTPDDIFVGTPPLAFTYGLGGVLLFPLRVGASTFMLERASPDALLGTIAGHGATVLFAAPPSYRSMVPLVGRYDISTLRACVSAGEALPASTRALWETATSVRIIDGIGSTEMLHIFIAASGDEIRPGATGKAVPGYVASVHDDDGQEVPVGTVGRLAVKGPTGCRYLADPRQHDYVRNGWNYTGDAYFMDEDGYFWYQARTDDMIVASGYNIAGPEVEGVLLDHPAVVECAVVGEPDSERGTIVKAYVVVRDRSGDDELVRELQDFVKVRIAPYKYPRAIAFVTELPRTQTGKLQRYRLREVDAPK